MRDQDQQAYTSPFTAAALQFADAMHHVERMEQGRGHRDGAVDPTAALLQAFDHQHAGLEVNPIGGERQRLGQPAAGIGQRHAERPHLAVSQLGLAEEDLTLPGGQVLARPVRGVQPHAGGGQGLGRRSRHWVRSPRSAAGRHNGRTGGNGPGVLSCPFHGRRGAACRWARHAALSRSPWRRLAGKGYGDDVRQKLIQG